MPRPVAQMTDDGLDEQAREGRCNPKQGDVILGRTQRLEDAGHVAALQGKAELNAQETETHVPDFPEGKPLGVHQVTN